VFLSSIPITILMNSLRIAITGVLANAYGIAAAEGFFHEMEGWLVFCACILLLFAEMKLLCLIGRGKGRSLLKRLDLDWPARQPIYPSVTRLAPLITAGLFAALACGTILMAGNRSDVLPTRSEFASFPRSLDGWFGLDVAIDREALDSLKPSDYLSVNFQKESNIVNVWIAYYAAQSIGDATHSPRICIPGGGWTITSFKTAEMIVPGTGGASQHIRFNRAVIGKGSDTELVYYWFQGRGRIESSDYWLKWHLMTDAVLRDRTDGALVRFVTPIRPSESEDEADLVLKRFIARIQPALSDYLPN
jgi:exosortase D (VPLPA-CTERM-specific)